MTDRSEEENPFEEAIRILNAAPDATDFLVKRSTDPGRGWSRQVLKRLVDHVEEFALGLDDEGVDNRLTQLIEGCET